MGKERSALAFARANIDAWTGEIDRGGLDAVAINASGCGTTIKDYGFMFREDEAYAAKAERIAALAKDVTEVIGELGLPPASTDANLVVAYHSACSMQHGQKITTLPKQLLAQLGFTVRDVPEGHLCCGSAGTYNLLQPEIAGRLRDRKIANIESVRPDVIATGNIGCMTQLGSGTRIPVVHTVELYRDPVVESERVPGEAPAGPQRPRDALEHAPTVGPRRKVEERAERAVDEPGRLVEPEVAHVGEVQLQLDMRRRRTLACLREHGGRRVDPDHAPSCRPRDRDRDDDHDHDHHR